MYYANEGGRQRCSSRVSNIVAATRCCSTPTVSATRRPHEPGALSAARPAPRRDLDGRHLCVTNRPKIASPRCMDFTISTEMRSLLERIETCMRTEVYPREAAFLHQPSFALETGSARGTAARAAGRAVGAAGTAHARRHGTSLRDFALVSEALGRSPLGHYLFGCQAPDAATSSFCTNMPPRRSVSASCCRWCAARSAAASP